MDKKIIKKAQAIQLIGMDVDGVMTDGSVLVLKSGEEVKWFNARDRLVLSLLKDRQAPILLVWISGRSSDAVTTAAKELGIAHVVQGCHDKEKAFSEILQEHGLTYAESAYIGDDLIDLPVLKRVALSACPSDAVKDVKDNVMYISEYAGGRGVVRDVIELVLRAQKKWQPLIAPFLS